MADPSPCFDRVLTALNRQEPDRVPVGELWVDPAVKGAFLGRPIQSLRDDVDFWLNAGYDFITLDSDLWATPQVQESLVRPAADTGSSYGPEAGDRNWIATEAGVIKTLADVKRFDWPQAQQISYGQYQEVAGLLPPGMRVLVTFGHVFTATWQLMGFEAFCLALYEGIGLIGEVMERVGWQTLTVLETVLSFDVVGAVCFQDDIAYTSGLMIPPGRLRELFFPWLKRAAEISHAHGRPLIYHSDGKLDEVLPDVVACGADGLQAIEPKCMDIVAVKRTYGDRLALMGNLDLGYLLTRGSPAEVVDEVKRLIRDVAPGGGFLLGSTNSITNYVRLENYRAMLEAVFEFGRYPISL